MTNNNPKAFISYSWDDEIHRDWVSKLASQLMSDGVDVTLDAWDVKPGDQLPLFMESAVRGNDFVLCICTPEYKRRSDLRKGGVGYEGNVMTAEAFNGATAHKFIPVLRKGDWSDAAPSWLLGKAAINLSSEGFDNGEYHRLVKAIYRSGKTKPKIGSRPEWIVDSVPKGRYRLVAFDLDGTLLRGFDFSWRLVWNHLGYPDTLRKEGMRRYLSGNFTYPQWCEWCVAHFRDKGLDRSAFVEIGKRVRLTNNLALAIRALRREGVVTAVVSGGIDSVLDMAIPNAKELFDYIYINKLLFDSEGKLSGVIPTEYDYDGKPIAIERICQERGFHTDQAVFVGEGHNDAAVIGRVGLVIAYPPSDQRVDQASHVAVNEDDLLMILPHILQS